MTEINTHNDRLTKSTEGLSLSPSDIGSLLHKDNGQTTIGGLRDNERFKTAQLSANQLKALGLPSDVTIDGHSDDANSIEGASEKIEKSAKSDGAALGRVKSSGDVVYKDPTEGWSMASPGHWEKNTPLPKDWDSMTPDERQRFLSDLEKKDMDPFMLVGPGGEARTGWHKDPNSGEYFWFGYVGQEPKGPPPPGGNHNYYL